jgi:ribosomal-protein-alanine N-acetyltransferase
MFAIQSQPQMVMYTPDEAWKGKEDWDNFYNFACAFYDEKEVHPRWFRFYFAIREKGFDRVIGYCGIGTPQFDRHITEVFYGLVPDKWGQGYATEAVKKMLNFGFCEVKLKEIVGFCEEENIASSRVLEKAGLKVIGKLKNLPDEFKYYNGEPLYKINLYEYRKHMNL